ncbi:tetratricopeptide repeat protein [Saccharothrix sp. NPDC042600]|uniref:ATP-binding protein n=1 Tax=Saccharothrix TaxID=2071 RepID=UPI00340546B6|nr:hypothetical protein GCM10017745_00750 [Saccharothrix mutabilis subsp. capreolus]
MHNHVHTADTVVQAGAIHGDVHLHPAPPGVPAPRQLPPAPTPFTGRAAELAALGTGAITAVHGTGGIGKTWLALRWAHDHADEFPDGHLHADLRGAGPDALPPAAVLGGFLGALGVPPDRVPADVAARSALFRSVVAGRRLLVVLDDAADTAQVAPLLPGTSTGKVLVTSRSTLSGLVTGHGARPVALDVLADDEARALLTARLGPDRTAGGAAADLVALCGGFPLALGIAAGRAQAHPALPLATLVSELREDRLDALDDGDPAASLPAVFSSAYRALDPAAARVFGLLGLAPGPDAGPLTAAASTGLPVARARAVLRRLAAVSLVGFDGRYRMHDLVRRFAADRARRDLDPADRDAALRRVVDFLLHTAYAADRVLHPHRRHVPLDPPSTAPHPPPDEPAALAWFAAELPALAAAQRAAAALGLHRAVLGLAWSTDTFVTRRGLRTQRLDAWRAALEAAPHLDDPVLHALAHRALGHVCTQLGRHAEAVRHLRSSLALSAGDRESEAHTHQWLAFTWGRRGDARRACRHATRALDLHRAGDHPVWTAAALNTAGWYRSAVGDHDLARRHCVEALALHRANGDRTGEAATLDSLGLIDHRTGRHRESVEHYRAALVLFETNPYKAADTLAGMGHPLTALGAHDEARAAWREAARLYREQHRAADAERVGRLLG